MYYVSNEYNWRSHGNNISPFLFIYQLLCRLVDEKQHEPWNKNYLVFHTVRYSFSFFIVLCVNGMNRASEFLLITQTKWRKFVPLRTCYNLQLVHDNEEWLEIQKTDLQCACQAIDRLRNKLFTLRLNKLRQRSTPGSVYCVSLKFPQRYIVDTMTRIRR